MRKLAVLMLCIVMLSGCNTKKEVLDSSRNDGSTSLGSISFDRDEADKLVEEIEAPIAALKSRESLTREEYGALEKQLEAIYPAEYARDILREYIDYHKSEVIAIKQDVSYPTIDENGIEIIQVFVERKGYDDKVAGGPPQMAFNFKEKGEALKRPEVPSDKMSPPEPKDREMDKVQGPETENREHLIVEEGYTGEDESLLNFKRVYKFKRNKEDQWIIESIEKEE